MNKKNEGEIDIEKEKIPEIKQFHDWNPYAWMPENYFFKILEYPWNVDFACELWWVFKLEWLNIDWLNYIYKNSNLYQELLNYRYDYTQLDFSDFFEKVKLEKLNHFLSNKALIIPNANNKDIIENEYWNIVRKIIVETEIWNILICLKYYSTGYIFKKEWIINYLESVISIYKKYWIKPLENEIITYGYTVDTLNKLKTNLEKKITINKSEKAVEYHIQKLLEVLQTQENNTDIKLQIIELKNKLLKIVKR